MRARRATNSTGKPPFIAPISRESWSRLTSKRLHSEGRPYIDEAVLPGWPLAVNRQTTATLSVLDRDECVYVAGHRGLVGSAIWRKLKAAGFTNLVGRTSSELDLTDRVRCLRLVLRAEAFGRGSRRREGRRHQGQQHLPGGLPFGEYPDPGQRSRCGDGFSARRRLLFLGSSCIYPKFAPQPIREDYLLTGHLEPTNDAYAIAKIAGILQVQAVRRQYGLPWISAMPTNLYGPGDNFSAEGSHVLPALIRRYDDAAPRAPTSRHELGYG